MGDQKIEDVLETIWRPTVVLQDERSKELTGKKPPKMNPVFLREKYRSEMDFYSSKVKYSGTSTNKVYCSKSPLASLKLIGIADMKINIPSKGCFLVLRTLEKPRRLVGIMTIVEDHVGDVYKFAAYNLFAYCLKEDLDELLPVGTVFILKEPFVKPSREGSFIIRCDCPSDIIIIRRHHKFYKMFRELKWKNKIEETSKKEPTTFGEWKDLGNSFYVKKRYFQALECYLIALESYNKGDTKACIVINLNLAATYLQLQYYEDVLKRCNMVLNMDPQNLKALYRAGRAHYELRHYEQANDYFLRLSCEDPTNVDSSVQGQRCKERLREQNGEFDLRRLYVASENEAKTQLDCADYKHCDIDITTLPQEGRVAVANRDIKVGTLLVVSKALFVAFKDDTEVIVQWHTDHTRNKAEPMKLVHEVAFAVIKNPETIGSLVYDLPLSDPFLNSIPPKRFCDEDNKEEPISDVQRIRKIISSNGICIEPNKFSVQTTDNSGLGLFSFPSFLKHSCLSNASWTTFNDIAVIHASRNIKAGEMVTISRCSAFNPYSERQRICLSWDRICSCKLCELDQKESTEQRELRERSSNQLEHTLFSYVRNEKVEDQDITDICQVVQIIEDGFRKCGRSELKIDLIYGYSCLALRYMRNGCNSQKPMKLLLKAIAAAGFDPDDLLKWSKGKDYIHIPENSLFSIDSIFPLQLLVCFFLEKGKLRDARKWWKVIEMAENVLTGASVDMIKHKYNMISEENYKKLLD